jgi:AcrR family transcriptional regulator
MTVQPTTPLDPGPVVDGRRLRSEASRLRIVEAMIALVSEGLTMPPAEAVAARAGVGLRTVFRLFEDMDGLYRGMQAVMTERLGSLLEGPIEAADWRDAINILIDRRGRSFRVDSPAADRRRQRAHALSGSSRRSGSTGPGAARYLAGSLARRDPERRRAGPGARSGAEF